MRKWGDCLIHVTCDVRISWTLRDVQWQLPLPQEEQDIGNLHIKVGDFRELRRMTAQIRRPDGYVIRIYGSKTGNPSFVSDIAQQALDQIDDKIKFFAKDSQLNSLTEWLDAQGWGWRREGDDIVAAKGTPYKTPKELEELARYLLDPPDDWHGKARIEGVR